MCAQGPQRIQHPAGAVCKFVSKVLGKQGLCSDKEYQGALAGVAQWTECQPVNQRVTGSILSQVIGWVVGQVPIRGVLKRQPHIDVSLHLFSFTSPCSKNK